LSGAKIRHTLVRHEQGAGFAADGYARLSGRPAAVFVISGPGLTNILTAAAQAYTDSVPLLVVASTPIRASLGKQWGVLHELPNQCALAAQVFGVARAAHSADELRDHLRMCLASLRRGRPRPAYLEIPLDLLAETTTLRAERFAEPSSLPQATADSVDQAVRLLTAAQRPVIIAGGGARDAGAELRVLVERLGGYLVTTTAGKGLLADDHPANLGASLPYRPVQDLLNQADVVLAVGTELAETDIFYAMRIPMNGTLIRIDIDPVKLADHYGAALPIWGDARASLQAINQRLAALDPRASTASAALPVKAPPLRPARDTAASIRARIEQSFDAKNLAQLRALKAIRAALPADAAVFSDMTQIAYLGNYAFTTDAPNRWFHPCGYGTLGFALPAAIGAKISSPARTVIALAGDFGVQFTLGELMTAVEARLCLPIVVWNNAALGQIRDDMLAANIPALGVVARNPDFQATARAFGAAAVRVTDAAGLTAALRGALSVAGPTLIEVVAADF
jgi:5-guanidino-2-oxopentanoate decarboxylase